MPLIADTSVVLKWFRTAREDEVAEAQLLLRAHRAAQVEVKILDLTVYELGNILLRSFRAPAEEVADQLEHIVDDAMWAIPKYREMLFVR